MPRRLRCRLGDGTHPDPQPAAERARLFVSYGNAKFPSVVVVLQGEGVKLEVEGESFVSSAGALRTTFASLPDAPITTFEALLAAGPYSVFNSAKSTTVAQASQCGENLPLPITLIAHNGDQHKTNQKLQVTGCPPATPKVSLLKTTITTHGLTLRVKTSTRGQLQITGTSIKTLTQKNLPGGTHQFTLPLTKTGRSDARTHKKTNLTITLTTSKHKAQKHPKITL